MIQFCSQHRVTQYRFVAVVVFKELLMNAPNILLVDDEPSMLRYTKTLLELSNYTVDIATTGEEVLERMNRGSAPTLILLYLAMPGMDVLELLESCKKSRPEHKVVMLSS